MRLDPLLTCAPATGAIRPVTEDLLRETFLAPLPVAFPLREALAGRAAPWSDSLAAAPEETAMAVETALVAVMRAAPALDPEALAPEALPEGRARAHLAALQDLWRDLGALPAPLDAIANALGCTAAEALEPLPVLDPAPCPHADAVEGRLADHLHGLFGAAPEAARTEWQTRQPPRAGRAPGALGAVQRGLGRAAERVAPDATLALFGLRDAREEAAFAAARALRLLEAGAVDSPAELGILVPEEPAYALALPEAFDPAGLPLSGGPATPAGRDQAGEVLTAALAVLEGPGARTALATLYAHPAMPWPRETGRRMAREVIERGASRTARALMAQGCPLLEALRPAGTAGQVGARLAALAAALPGLDLSARLGPMRGVLAEGLDWPALRRLAAPRPVPAEGAERFVEGVSIFSEAALPWRPVRHLIVLGLSGRGFPRMPAASPVFTEAETAQLRAGGLALPGRRERLARGLDLFRRQLAAARDGATLTAPARDLRGEPQPPTTALALITHLLGAKEPRDILTDLRALPPEGWPVAHHRPAPLPGGGAPRLPADGRLRLGDATDLLRLRDEPDRRATQSPSRLETLLVSPLAWLMDELDAKDRTWAPETLDALTLGSVMHKVVELLFPAAAPLPDAAKLATALPAALASAIAAEAPWLAGPDWAAERASLVREAEATVQAWARFLRASGAEILHNEVELSGEAGGLTLAGRADCLARLADGRVLVVDHKRSRATGRRERMARGWDLQVALYRAMLLRPAAETPLTALVQAGARPVTAYHTILDRCVLVDEAGRGIAGAETVEGDISVHAMALLSQRVAEVGSGTVVLNRAGDLKRFERDCAITAYPLKDNPFVTAFLMPEEDAPCS